MPPKIMFLDDNENRHKAIYRHLFHDKAYTIDEAICLIMAKEYDIIFLGHDLGGEEMVDSARGGTGYEVAKYIVENKVQTQLVVVHSLNGPGRENMVSHLQRGGYRVIGVPFTALPAMIDQIFGMVKYE